MSQVYSCSQTSPLLLESVHDPNAEVYYTLQYRAPAWSADKTYLEKTCGEVGDLVTPLAENGFLYECKSGGVSGPNEPAWPTVTGELIDDGTVSWETIADAFNLLRHGETITASEWAVDGAFDENDNPLDSSSIVFLDEGVSGGITFVKVSGPTIDMSYFILRNRITVQRTGAITETMDYSLKIKVKEM